ncbi:NAD(P)H-dependent oxidoreductase [Paenibacillus sp. 481]|uniref:NAD(P)H-dependent oxidoreductase n=1 Tax=Paenibacillus sp. 481 TaxID=2835869 RepID=UPI001E324A99|nr:NAD(P)H-dependent oxidoreductase [Paenibacillus sp. 481]UHA73990.1 NAD(P)H-dependent oxidoreductase [Paenibacillus sp. 481]
MKNLVLYAHPNPQSFNHAILETVTNKLKANGHEVEVRDLYAMNYNPVLTGNDFEGYASGNLPEDIATEQKWVTWADHIIVIYPVWWTGLPAILKGYFDRVFSHGFAYRYTATGIDKLLSGRSATLFTTQGNAAELYELNGTTKAMQLTSDVGIFEFVGMNVLDHRFYAAVPLVDDAARKEMLKDVERVIDEQVK